MWPKTQLAAGPGAAAGLAAPGGLSPLVQPGYGVPARAAARLMGRYRAVSGLCSDGILAPLTSMGSFCGLPQ